MKSKASGWLFVIAVLAIAGVLFLPVAPLTGAVSLQESFKRLDFVSILTWCLAAAAFWGFKARFWPNDPRESRRFSSAVLLLLLQAVLVRSLFEVEAACRPLPWSWFPADAWIWVPWFVIPSLTGMLIGGRFAIVVCLTGALMLYLVADPGPWPLMGCMTSALVGILLLWRSPTRARVLRAGAGAGGTIGLIAASHYAMQRAPLEAVTGALLFPLVIGCVSAFLVLAALPVMEWVLGELSDVTLVEYGADHVLLDELKAQAPGTWHHCLNVADLAEKAAAAIGARVLFCKTSALYHDIGKLKEPALFAENNAGPSPHDQLEPQQSAQKIIEHVSHGLALARKHRLPKPFREIIAEHHGVSVVRFFYAKALQPRPDGSCPKVDRALFSYPGPAPSTRESGIVALADAIEAASRSLASNLEPDLRAFVRRLFADRICAGELAHCPLTLSDLAKVEAAFVVWLKGRNHYRPAYPTGGR